MTRSVNPAETTDVSFDGLFCWFHFQIKSIFQLQSASTDLCKCMDMEVVPVCASMLYISLMKVGADEIL